MPKELIISFAFLGVFLLALMWGIVDTAIVKNPIFLLVGVVSFVGQVVTAHLAFNQFKQATELETANKETDNDGGRENGEDGEDGESDGFDD